jgi:hypothetical protein
MTNQLAEFKKEVFARRPVLGQIFHKYGSYGLKDYVKNHWLVPAGLPDEVFVRVLKTELEAIYGADIAQKAIAGILKKPLVSTIDHLGIWGHPIFVNADLIYSLHFPQNNFPLVLATESVSLNNTSSWSASLLVHSGDGLLKRHSFLPDRLKTLPAFSAPAVSETDISHFHKMTGGRFNELAGALALSSLTHKTFSVQACLASREFWHAVFPSAPKLVYLPLETIISKYLLKVFEDPKHVLSQIIMGEAGRRLWDKYFPNEHTCMFWAIDPKGKRLSLKSLPENLPELIKGRKIYPSSPICFIVLLYAGLACAGGFTQTTWLTDVKEKFAALLMEMETKESLVSALSLVPTQNFAEGSLAVLKIGGQYLTPTATDLYFAAGDYYSKYAELAERITLGQSIELAMPAIYSVVTPKAEQAENFLLEKCQQEVLHESKARKILADLGI